MFDEKFTGMITSVSAGVKTAKAEDGTKVKVGIYKVKLESASIDYEAMSKFNPAISQTLLNIQPMPFKSVNFGDQAVMNMALKFFNDDMEEADSNPEKTYNDEADAEFGRVIITNLTVSVKENIPVYVFMLDIPMKYDGKFLFRNLKSKISFEFSKMEIA